MTRISTCPLGPIYHEAIVLVIPTIRDPSSADPNPATEKLSSMAATSPNIAAFRTSRNNPSVTMVSGNVSRKAIGRTKPLTRPSNSAASMKVPVPAI